MGFMAKMFSKKNEKPVENVNKEVTGNDVIIAGEVVKQGEVKENPSVYYILYVTKLSGLKGVPFNTFILLVNDHSKNNLTINYEMDGEIKVDTISRSKITNISFNMRVQFDNNKDDYTEEHKNNLAKGATFNGFPLLQVLGANTSNYAITPEVEQASIDLNNYYEITLTYLNEENESQRILFGTEDNPEKFINFLKTNINK